MKLSDWLQKHRLTHEDLAGRIGCDTSTISRLVPKPGKKQTRRPSFDLASKIAHATEGEVTANDFMDEEPDEDVPPSLGGGGDGLKAASAA